MDSEEFLNDWKKSTLSEEERGVKIGLDSNLDVVLHDQLNHYLVGKLLSSRTIALGIIKNAFNNAWRIKLGFTVENLGKNLHLIKFDSCWGKDLILNLGPWIFDKSLLALEIPKTNIKLSQLTFEHWPSGSD